MMQLACSVRFRCQFLNDVVVRFLPGDPRVFGQSFLHSNADVSLRQKDIQLFKCLCFYWFLLIGQSRKTSFVKTLLTLQFSLDLPKVDSSYIIRTTISYHPYVIILTLCDLMDSRAIISIDCQNGSFFFSFLRFLLWLSPIVYISRIQAWERIAPSKARRLSYQKVGNAHEALNNSREPLPRYVRPWIRHGSYMEQEIQGETHLCINTYAEGISL